MKSIKILSALLVIAMLAGIMTVAVGAKAPAYEGVCRTETGFGSVREALADAIAQSANETIENLVVAAQNNPNANIKALVRVTNRISASAICLINLLGFEAECVYEEYEINGQTVLIDPIIVIKR